MPPVQVTEWWVHKLAEIVKDDPTNNVPDSIFSKLGMQLHRRDQHPLGILKNAIFDYFDTNYPNNFVKFDNLGPIVSVKAVCYSIIVWQLFLSVNILVCLLLSWNVWANSLQSLVLYNAAILCSFMVTYILFFNNPSDIWMMPSHYILFQTLIDKIVFLKILFNVAEWWCIMIFQNFDDVLVPADHVSRSYNDTYYVDSQTVFRCHTSAHQAELLREGHTHFLVTGDVYRRDSIDSTHYPVFHQVCVGVWSFITIHNIVMIFFFKNIFLHDIDGRRTRFYSSWLGRIWHWCYIICSWRSKEMSPGIGTPFIW